MRTTVFLFLISWAVATKAPPLDKLVLQEIFGGVLSQHYLPLDCGCTSCAYLVNFESGEYAGMRAVLRVSKVTSQHSLDAMESETTTLKNLFHSNIVYLIDASYHEASNSYFQLLELGESGSLKNVRQNFPRLFANPLYQIDLFLGVAKGLLHLRNMGIVHADLKPENVVVTHNNIPKIIDFNLKLTAGKKDVARGSPLFLDPRIMQRPNKRHKYDSWIDVAAFGATLLDLNCQRESLLYVLMDKKRGIYQRYVATEPAELFQLVTDGFYEVEEGTELTVAYLINRSRQLDPGHRLSLEQIIQELTNAKRADRFHLVRATKMSVRITMNKSDFQILKSESKQNLEEKLGILLEEKAEREAAFISVEGARQEVPSAGLEGYVGLSEQTCCHRIKI